MKNPLLQHNPWLKHYAFLVLFAMLSYWPVSFMAYSLKGDAINYFLAMRYNISEAIQDGIFPLWSPYINLGYPLHGDMQSGVWNPVVFLISLTGKYDIYRLHVETMITIITGGIGMYHLLKYLKLEKRVVLGIAAAYMLNGYIADAGQFLTWLYAASFLPLVILFTLRCFTQFAARDAFFLGVAHSFMFLCSYPADFILLSYIILLFTILSFLKTRKEKGTGTSLKLFSRQVILVLLTFVITCLPAILSYWPFFHSIDRGAGVNLYTALLNSMAPANFISFLAPWATLRGRAFADTDPLIRNCYIGIIPFIFFLAFLLNRNKKDFIQKFLIFIFFFFLVFSLGKFGGIRTLTYYLLPLLNTFKHPANAKLFFIFSAQVLAAFGINQYLLNHSFNKSLLPKIVWPIFIITLLSFFIGFFKSNFSRILNDSIRRNHDVTGTLLKEVRDSLSFYDLLFLNCSFLLILIILILFFLKKELLKKYLLPVLFADMFIVLQGMLPLTYVRNSHPGKVENILLEQPRGFPKPDPAISIAKYSENGMEYFDQIGCLNPYNKKPGRSDYVITPSNLSTQDFFWNYAAFRNKIIKYPLAYIADTMYLLRDTAFFIRNKSLKKAVLVDSNATITSPFPFTGRENTVTMNTFLPEKIEFEIQNTDSALFVLQQNYYYNWEAFINDIKTEIFPANITFMGVRLPAGNNKLTFKYRVPYLPWITAFSVLFVLAGFIIIFIKKIG